MKEQLTTGLGERLVRSRTSASLIGVLVKSKSSMSLASGSLAYRYVSHLYAGEAGGERLLSKHSVPAGEVSGHRSKAHHSITSSAQADNPGEASRPSASFSLRGFMQIPTKSPADSEMMSPGDTR
jgi:hypothetical protein